MSSQPGDVDDNDPGASECAISSITSNKVGSSNGSSEVRARPRTARVLPPLDNESLANALSYLNIFEQCYVCQLNRGVRRLLTVHRLLMAHLDFTHPPPPPPPPSLPTKSVSSVPAAPVITVGIIKSQSSKSSIPVKSSSSPAPSASATSPSLSSSSSLNDNQRQETKGAGSGKQRYITLLPLRVQRTLVTRSGTRVRHLLLVCNAPYDQSTSYHRVRELSSDYQRELSTIDAILDIIVKSHKQGALQPCMLSLSLYGHGWTDHMLLTIAKLRPYRCQLYCDCRSHERRVAITRRYILVSTAGVTATTIADITGKPIGACTHK